MTKTLILTALLTLFGSMANAQCQNGSCAPGVRTFVPFSQPMVLSSRENNPPLTPTQLTAMGYSLQRDPSTGRQFWSRQVSQSSSFGAASSSPGSGVAGRPTSSPSPQALAQRNDWRAAPRLDRPLATPIQTPPPGPAPIAPVTPAPIPVVDVDKIVDKIIDKLINDPRFRGPPGPPGEQGPPGNPGAAGINGKDATVDTDAIVAAVFKKMPPVQIHYLDKTGQVVEQETFAFGAPIRVQPIHVQNFDVNGKLVDEEQYPWPGPIRLKDRPAQQFTAPR